MIFFFPENSSESKMLNLGLLKLCEKVGTPIHSSLQYSLVIIHLSSPESLVHFPSIHIAIVRLIAVVFTLEIFRRFIFFLHKAESVTQSTAVSRVIP